MDCEHHFHITQEARMCLPPWPHRFCCRCGHAEDAQRSPVLELPPRKQYYTAGCGKWREIPSLGVVETFLRQRESDKPWFIIGEYHHDCGKPYSCRCDDQYVDIADKYGDVFWRVPRYTAEAMIALHDMVYDDE